MFNKFRFSATQNWTPSLIPVNCTLISPCAIDVSGNKSFYFTTNVTGNFNVMTITGEAGRNILEKTQLMSDGTGI